MGAASRAPAFRIRALAVCKDTRESKTSARPAAGVWRCARPVSRRKACRVLSGQPFLIKACGGSLSLAQGDVNRAPKHKHPSGQDVQTHGDHAQGLT